MRYYDGEYERVKIFDDVDNFIGCKLESLYRILEKSDEASMDMERISCIEYRISVLEYIRKGLTGIYEEG